jgi:hypothetical protein
LILCLATLFAQDVKHPERLPCPLRVLCKLGQSLLERLAAHLRYLHFFRRFGNKFHLFQLPARSVWNSFFSSEQKMMQIRVAAAVAIAALCTVADVHGESTVVEEAKLREMARRAISGGNTLLGSELGAPDPKDIIENNKQGSCDPTQSYDYFVYSGLSDGVNWNDAQQFCTNPDGFNHPGSNGGLVSISCKEELDFVKTLVASYGGKDSWVGGKRCTSRNNKCSRTKPNDLNNASPPEYYDEAL